MASDPHPILILNPLAGSVDDADELEAMLATELDCPVVRTREGGDARRLAREAAGAGRPMVVAGGGDGTVAEVVQGLLDAEPSGGPTLAIIPLGTGNDLARCLEIPLEVEPALAVARAGGPGITRPLDVMRVVVDGDPVLAINAVIMGNGGRLGEILDPEMKDRWGPLSYLRSAGQVAFELQPVPVEVTWDAGEPVREEILNLVVANGRYAGGGIPIAPHSDPADGRLDVVQVRPAPLPRLLALLPTLLREEDPDAEIYGHRTATSVRVRSVDGAIPVSIDGEYRKAAELAVTVLPHRLQVRVPGD